MLIDEDDVLEAVHGETLADVLQHGLERLFADAEGPRIAHVTGRRLEVPFGYELDDRRAQGVAQRPGDVFARGLEDVVVLPHGDVGTVLLDPPRRYEDRGLARRDGVANLDPRELFEPDRIERLDRPRHLELLLLPPLPLGPLFRREIPLRPRARGRPERPEREHPCNEERSFLGHWKSSDPGKRALFP